MINRGYFHSPIGLLEIISENEKLDSINFLEDSTKQESNPDNVVEGCIQCLSDYFAGKLTRFDTTLYLQGTEFQNRVWNQLIEIPFGTTISYTELSMRLGDPKCIRAAASANGKNRLPILVPCHRVIGASGKLVGYAGGLWRKQWLLEHEQKVSGKGNLFSDFLLNLNPEFVINEI
jgi:methylated-DNA-[protein]-cysteine S-methyltransferase